MGQNGHNGNGNGHHDGAGASPNGDGQPPDGGGRGGFALFGNRGHTEHDCNMIRRAIREGWSIPDRVYRSLPAEMLDWMDRCTDWTPKIAIARLLTIMDGANQKDAHEVFKAYRASRGLDDDSSSDDTPMEWVEPDGLLE